MAVFFPFVLNSEGRHGRDSTLGPKLALNVKVCGAASKAVDKRSPLPPRPATPPGYVSLELVPRDVERTVEDAEDVNVSVILEEVGNPIVPIEEYSYVAR